MTVEAGNTVGTDGTPPQSYYMYFSHIISLISGITNIKSVDGIQSTYEKATSCIQSKKILREGEVRILTEEQINRQIL